MDAWANQLACLCMTQPGKPCLDARACHSPALHPGYPAWRGLPSPARQSACLMIWHPPRPRPPVPTSLGVHSFACASSTRLPCRYALFYLLREIGTLEGPMGEFIDTVRTAGSPTQQLKLLNSYRPAELALTGASEEQWDAAVYTTLDRATLLKRLMRASGSAASTAVGSSSSGHGGSGFGGGSADSSPRYSSSAAGSSGSPWGGGNEAGPAFSGPVAALLPRDRLGALMLEATQHHLAAQPLPAGSPAAAAARGSAMSGRVSSSSQVLHIPLDSRHTECLLSDRARKATSVLLMDAVRALLPRL